MVCVCVVGGWVGGWGGGLWVHRESMWVSLSGWYNLPVFDFAHIRYEERMKYIRTLTDVKLQSSFENFAENVMHPLEMSSSQAFVSSSTLRSSPQKVPSSRTSMIAAPVSIQSQLHTLGQQTPNQSEDRLTASGLFRQALEVITSPPRQRSSTNDERMLRAPMHNGSDMHLECVCVSEWMRERERERERRGRAIFQLSLFDFQLSLQPLLMVEYSETSLCRTSLMRRVFP